MIETAQPSFHGRRRVADRVFRGALIFNAALTVFWLYVYFTNGNAVFFPEYTFDLGSFGRVLLGVLFFNVLWGFIWYGIKTTLLKYFVGFSPEERRRAFSSRMDAPFDASELVARHSERRIRIVDMIGRRGRFMMLAGGAFYYLYTRVVADPTPSFITAGLFDNLFDSLVTNWIFLGFYYANGFLAAAFYGPQSRIMDGVLARANCLLITTLWGAFKFILVPVGAQIAAIYPTTAFAPVFALIWGSYLAADAFSEIGGSLFGKQTIRVRGVGDVNRKSVGGTISGFVASLVLCIAVVMAHGLPSSWLVLCVVLALSNSVVELFSPRGTDDFTMATVNAMICWTFGAIVY